MWWEREGRREDLCRCMNRGGGRRWEEGEDGKREECRCMDEGD